MRFSTATCITISATALLGPSVNAQVIPDGIPTCAGCFCIADTACPDVPLIPKADWAAKLSSIRWTNPITIDCNPFDDPACQLTGSDFGGDDPSAAVCAISYDYVVGVDAGATCPITYTTKTFASMDDIEEGYVLTHVNACAACSSLQDLAAFMTEPDFASIGQQCGFEAIQDRAKGNACYQKTGVSESCAQVLTDNALASQAACFNICIDVLGEPPNDTTEPSCPLNDCIQCDQRNNGRAYIYAAGRTAYGSGLLSTMIPPCSDFVAAATPVDPCPGIGSGQGEDDSATPGDADGDATATTTDQNVSSSRVSPGIGTSFGTAVVVVVTIRILMA